jgi:hypothetical protein
MFDRPPLTSVAEAHRRAKQRLPKAVYVSMLTGSEEGLTLRNNLEAFREVGLHHLDGLGPWLMTTPSTRQGIRARVGM